MAEWHLDVALTGRQPRVSHNQLPIKYQTLGLCKIPLLMVSSLHPEIREAALDAWPYVDIQSFPIHLFKKGQCVNEQVLSSAATFCSNATFIITLGTVICLLNIICCHHLSAISNKVTFTHHSCCAYLYVQLCQPVLITRYFASY